MTNDNVPTERCGEDGMFTTIPSHPEHPITFYGLSSDTEITFSLEGVTLTMPYPDNPQRVMQIRMDKSSPYPWTTIHNMPRPEQPKPLVFPLDAE